MVFDPASAETASSYWMGNNVVINYLKFYEEKQAIKCKGYKYPYILIKNNKLPVFAKVSKINPRLIYSVIRIIYIKRIYITSIYTKHILF